MGGANTYTHSTASQPASQPINNESDEPLIRVRVRTDEPLAHAPQLDALRPRDTSVGTAAAAAS